MKLSNWLTKALILFFCITWISCNKSDGGSDGGDDFFIPDLSAAGWVNKTDASNTFFFFSITDSVNTSTLEGNENLSAGGQDHFTGSFTNHQITFKYDAGSSSNKGEKSYTGTINNTSTEIILSSPDGLPALTLQKQ